MTRLNNSFREEMHRKIMKNLPSRNFSTEIQASIQAAVVEHMPPEVRAVWNDPTKRRFLNKTNLRVSMGNNYVPLYQSEDSDYITGLGNRDLHVRADESRESRLTEGSLHHTILVKHKVADLIAGYFEQEELRANVARRLRANLAAASNIKRLYEILEPELHHYIPKDVAKASLPACVAPVVDDLRRLGAILPTTPKAQPQEVTQ